MAEKKRDGERGAPPTFYNEAAGNSELQLKDRAANFGYVCLSGFGRELRCT